MIRTEFDDQIDLKKKIPGDATVGIIGCSDCSAVYGTSGSKRIKSIKEELANHCQICFTSSLNAPCDQRGFRLLAKNIDQLCTVDYLIVLACEAGSRSIGDFLQQNGAKKTIIITPVKTKGFSWIDTKNNSQNACIFCSECTRPERTGNCPVALCPLHRSDGPCQNRQGNSCVLDEGKECAWLI
jgi:hypothetical protein